MDSARPVPPPDPLAGADPDGLADPPGAAPLGLASPRTDTPAPTASGASAEVDQAPPGALARLGRLLPSVDAVVRSAYRLAGLSAFSVAVILWAVWDAFSLRMVPMDLAILGVILLVPAAAVALAGWTLADVARLPGQIRDAALAAAGRDEPASPKKRSRLGGLVRSVWAARGLAILTRGGWLEAVGALRFVRLASLPFALALVALVLMNGVILLGGLVALLTLIP